MDSVHNDAYNRTVLVTDFNLLLPQKYDEFNDFEVLNLPTSIMDELKEKNIVKPTNLQRILLPLLFKDQNVDILIETPKKEGITTTIAIAMTTIVHDLYESNSIDNKELMSPFIIVLFDNNFNLTNGKKIYESLSSPIDVKCLTVDSIDNIECTECNILLTTITIIKGLIDNNKIKCKNLISVVFDNGDYIMTKYGIPKTCQIMKDLYDLGNTPMRIFSAFRIYDSRREELLTTVRANTLYVRALMK